MQALAKRQPECCIHINKIDFRTRVIIRHKGGQHIMIKELMYQEKSQILNICAPNNRV